MKCGFCKKHIKDEEKHLCGKKYSYEYIFKQMFINILLDYEPAGVEDFYEICVRVVKNNKLFLGIENPFNIMWECLKIFVVEYDCF
tara:strand:+ start:1056 stop:1313 length:258 start_codon:yes stop_codon:yes gene_type:complete